MSWFTVEKIDENTYALSEYGYRNALHSYLFIGQERAALIDTGMGIGDIQAVVAEITPLPVWVVTTHAHWEHTGGHSKFQEILVHEAEQPWLEKGLPFSIEQIRAYLSQPDCFTDGLPEGFDPAQYNPYRGSATQVLKEGDRIDLGERSLQVLHTPGHSPGHICLYEDASGYLVTGDLLYEGELRFGDPGADPEAYASSILHISNLPNIKRLLPGRYRLDIPPTMVRDTLKHLDWLRKQGLLRRGAGEFTFGKLQIKF